MAACGIREMKAWKNMTQDDAPFFNMRNFLVAIRCAGLAAFFWSLNNRLTEMIDAGLGIR